MAYLRYLFTMDDHIPASVVVVYNRGAIVFGAQNSVTTVTVHEGHDFAIGDKFLYALSRTNILTNRIFTVASFTDTTITFSGAAMSFPDNTHLIPLGTESGGVLQDDGTYSPLNWDGSNVWTAIDENGDTVFTPASNIPVEPGGEVGFFADAASLWCVARSTSGKPLRVYIVAQSDSTGDITNITNNITTIEGDIVTINNTIIDIQTEMGDNETTQEPSAAQILLDTAFGWYRADSIVAANLVGGALVNAALVDTWYDSSGNDRHLTAHGALSAGTDTPTQRPFYGTAGQATSGNPYLPIVALNGTSAGGNKFGYFTFDGGPFTFSATPGWTLLFALRTYGAQANDSYMFGCDTRLGDPRAQDHIFSAAAAGNNIDYWTTQEGASAKTFSANYAHTEDLDTEVIGLRVAASTGGLETWVDGNHLAVTGDTRATSFVMRHIGIHWGGASFLGTFFKGLYELIIFDYQLTDAQMQTGSAYLLSRISGGTGTLLTQGIPRNIGTWNVNAVTDGTDTACSNGTAYCGSVFVPASMKVTGIQYLIGSVGGTNKVVASLHTSTGALVAASDPAGITVGTAAQVQQVPFLGAAAIVGPSWYFVALTFNGTTAKFRSVPAFCDAGSGVVGNGVTQTFGTPAAFTAPTTFTADKVPVASLY